MDNWIYHKDGANLYHQGHKLMIDHWGADCGWQAEAAICSCGFETTWMNGMGCWQFDHNREQEHRFDEFHLGLYRKAIELETVEERR